MAVNEITGMEDLPETKKLVGAFPAAPKGYIGPKELAPAQKEISERQLKAEEELAQSDIRIEKAKREEEATKAEKMKAFYEGEKRAMEALPEREAYKESVAELNAAKFEPKKDTLQDIAGLFSLIGVIGTVMSKGNAMQAMSAMNGMMEGHIKGRRDLVKQQALEFEKNFKALQTKVDAAYKELQDAVNLRLYDQKAGLEAITIAIARADSPLLKEMQARQGPLKTLAFLKDLKENTLGNSVKLNNDLRAKAEDRALRASKVSGKGTATSVLLAGRAENIREAFAQAAKDIVNVTKFPEGTMLGTFSGLTGASADSMINGIRNGIARGVTDKEQRMLETLIAGLEGHLAFALGGGYATSQSKARMDQYKAQLARAGDDPAQVPLMLARFKQEMNILADNFPSKPGATPEMNQSIQKYNDEINRAVPYTVEDVLTAQFSEAPKAPSPSSAGQWKIREK